MAFARAREISASRACGLARVSRRRLSYASRKDDGALVAELKDLAAAHPRYGSRRLCVMLRRERGRVVNLKKVRRLCREHGLLLRQKRRRKRRGIGAGVPCRAEHPGHVWAYDFVEDRTETGRKLRVLTVADEFTRECVAVEVEHRMNARFVAGTLLRLFGERGAPKYVRSDNGPEFIAKHLMRALGVSGVGARHIEPGSPWQNPYSESFNSRLRDEMLDGELFSSEKEARVLLERHRVFHNEERPHSSLGYVAPAVFARQCLQAGSAPAKPA